jgi:hypothetical protein
MSLQATVFGIREFVFIVAGGVAGNDDARSARAWTFTPCRCVAVAAK